MTIRITNPEEDRYQRLRLIRWWEQERMSRAKALVLGAGALGNEVVKNLALLGIGSVWIVDFDRIEHSNLTRSAMFRAGDVGAWKADVLAERARDLNPDCRVESLKCDVRYEIGLHFLSQIDVVFGCLDNREGRYHVNRSCYLLKKTFIDGGLDTLNGSVSIFQPPATACYECTLSSVDRAELQKRISCLKSVAPEIKHHIPTAPTIASIIGGLQAQIGVRLLHGLEIPAGKRLGLYGLSDLFFDVKLEISDECGLHSTIDPLPETRTLSASPEDSLATVLSHARKEWNAEALTWDFDRDLITALHCTSCGKQSDFTGTQSLYGGSLTCDCGGIHKPEISNFFTGTEPWGDRSFINLGFPPDHIYCAVAASERVYFTLASR